MKRLKGLSAGGPVPSSPQQGGEILRVGPNLAGKNLQVVINYSHPIKLSSGLDLPAKQGQLSAHRAPLYKLNAIPSCLLGWVSLFRAQTLQL